MSEGNRRVGSGIAGLDQAIDQFRLGDNVVWQVDTIENYRYVVEPYVKQARKDNRNLIYIRFGLHEPVIEETEDIRVYEVSPEGGFEDFATRIHTIIREEGVKAFYVFDCLTDLLKFLVFGSNDRKLFYRNLPVSVYTGYHSLLCSAQKRAYV